MENALLTAIVLGTEVTIKESEIFQSMTAKDQQMVLDSYRETLDSIYINSHPTDSAKQDQEYKIFFGGIDKNTNVFTPFVVSPCQHFIELEAKIQVGFFEKISKALPKIKAE